MTHQIAVALDSHVIEDPELGRLEVRTLPLPDTFLRPWGTYTATGTVLVAYETADDPDVDGWLNLAVVDDDGQNLRQLFSGPAPLRPRNNGMRLLPFADGKRVLMSDYILECEPSHDACEAATLVPLLYPSLVEDDPLALHRWSEPIIAPDNEHLCWTTLHATLGAYNVLGRLRRTAAAYEVDGAHLVSSNGFLSDDPERPGYVVAETVRGGEVKQFARGGTALSVAGTAGRALVDSVLQELDGTAVTALTLTPGYDETTILSPDESLGIVMTTRFSPATNCAVVGLLPRPYASISTVGLAMAAYWYGIGGVRRWGEGNIGPALVDLSRAMTDRTYLGANLSDPTGQWVYYSPMSWHPDSRRAAWNEGLRNGTNAPPLRIRLVTALDRAAGEPVRAVATPAVPPYARPLAPENLVPWAGPTGGRIAGAASGYVDVRRTGGEGLGAAAAVETTYVGYSDDGRTFLEGVERLQNQGGTASTVYEADLHRIGDDPGELVLRLTFTQESWNDPVRLSFAEAADGKPASWGHASYQGETLRVEDMAH